MTKKVTVRKDIPRCGVKLPRRTDGKTCGHPAGFRTDHYGDGRCYLHGGKTPIKHGMRSKVARTRLADLIEKHAANPDPLNLLPEIAQLRAYAEDLLDRWDEIYGPDGALLAWHESFRDPTSTVPPKPRQMPDLTSIGMIIDKVGAMAERVHKFQQATGVSLATLSRVMEQMAVEVVAACKETRLDEDTSGRLLDSVQRRWDRLGTEAVRPGGERAP